MLSEAECVAVLWYVDQQRPCVSGGCLAALECLVVQVCDLPGICSCCCNPAGWCGVVLLVLIQRQAQGACSTITHCVANCCTCCSDTRVYPVWRTGLWRRGQQAASACSHDGHTLTGYPVTSCPGMTGGAFAVCGSLVQAV
jgi:hypothetical protein